MLHVQNLTKRFGDRVILDKVTFRLGPRDRVAVVGANGAGKTTLLRILAGILEPDGGSVDRPTGASAGYLSQESQCPLGCTVRDAMLAAFPDLLAAQHRMEALSTELAGAAHDAPGRLGAIMEAYGRAQDEFEAFGGYTVDARIGRALHGLGFPPDARDRMTDEFSGGWQMRLALAQLLVRQPDLLLLDEPTNHLDAAARAWLEEYLQKYPGVVLLVSHDRAFLDQVAQRILALRDGQVTDYTGNYTAYRQQEEAQRRAQEAEHRRQERELARQIAFIERFRASATRSSQAKSRERLLEKVERVEAPAPETRTVSFRFASAPRSYREVATLEGVSKWYGDLIVLLDISLVLERGDRVALVGPNGAGKSTLLRLLAGEEAPSEGRVVMGRHVVPAYFAQHQAEALDLRRTVLDEAWSAARPGTSVEEVRSLLGRFLLTQSAVFKPVALLSGGERSRLALAKILLRPANFLLLDEPTNHLDAGSRRALEEALRSFDGTVVVVSHDEVFLRRVTAKVWRLGESTLAVGDWPPTVKRPVPAAPVPAAGGAGAAGVRRAAHGRPPEGHRGATTRRKPLSSRP